MKKYFFFITLSISISIIAQDLRGKWVNVYKSASEVDFMNLTSKTGDIYSGDSYDTSGSADFCKYTFKAKFDAANNIFLGKDDHLIEKTETHHGVAYRLRYEKEGNDEFLVGYGRMINDNGTLGSPFTVKYHKKAPEITEEEIAQIKEYRRNRKNPRSALINIYSEKVTLRIKDYGQEDNDSISVIFNDELLAHKIPIDKVTKEFEITLKPDTDNKLTFIANNVGDIPPNTTKVVIVSGEKEYKYTLFTNLQKNAVIDLRAHWKAE